MKEENIFVIVFHSGERYEVKFKSKEKVLSWIDTGAAGFLPIRSRSFVRLIPSKIKEIIELDNNV